MSKATPYEFHDAEEIVSQLRENESKIGESFDQGRLTLDEIIHSSVGRNTFRAFSKLPERPSLVFRSWAGEELKNQITISELLTIGAQSQYDEWAREFSLKLSHTWQKRRGETMPYGPSRKLPNLLLKKFVLWEGLSDVQRSELQHYLHIPLDSFTLVAIRNSITDFRIPKNATMSFVRDETIYNQIQQAIRAVAHRARVPAIYFDVLAWNMSHTQS